MSLKFFLLLSFLLVTACNNKPSEDVEKEIELIVQVQSMKLIPSDITQTITAYGTVTPLNNQLQNISVPFSSYVEKVLVTHGQRIKQGEPLVIVQASEDAQLLMTQTKQELIAAQQEFNLIQQRFHLQLATQQEITTAQLRVSQAQALLNDLTKRGVLHSHTITAPSHAIITNLSIQQGQRLIANAPLLEYISLPQLSISVGIEPENIEQVHLKQPVELIPINRENKLIKGQISLMSHQIDPLSHLINVIVKPDNPAELLLNETLQAKIMTATKKTLVAPRNAVLPDETNYCVFTIENNKAIKHNVELGLQTDMQVEIISPTLKENSDLVILGNYELKDGMAVELKP